MSRNKYINSLHFYNTYKEMYPDTKIDYSLFLKVLRASNKKIVELIVKKGYSYSMGHNLGELKVVQFETRFRKSKNGKIYGYPNWGESKKLKQEIIDRGGTPFEAFKDDKGNVIGDNGGENWMVYHTEDVSVRFYWWKQKFKTKSGENYFPLHYSAGFSFKPTKQNKLFLADFRRNNPEIEYMNNG